MERQSVTLSRSAVEVAVDLPFPPEDVAEAIGGAFHNRFQGRRPNVNRAAITLEPLGAVVLLALGIRGWDAGRTLAPLPYDRCRMARYIRLDVWLPGVVPIYLRIIAWYFRIEHQRVRRRLRPAREAGT